MKSVIRFFQAVSIIIGTIIGVGMFGLPFLFSKAGIILLIVYVVFFGYIQYLINILYANVIALNGRCHRLPGYAECYYGKIGKLVALIAKLIGNYGSLLAYTIITGIFLNTILSPIFGDNTFLYITIFYLIQSFIVLLGISTIAEFELVMTVFLIFVIIMIIYKGNDLMSISNFKFFDSSYVFHPYGAVLLALGGQGAVPLVSRILKRDPKLVKSSIKLGMILAYSITIIFTISIIGLSGAGTTEDALTGVAEILHGNVILLALIFGVITMTTSFVGIAESVKETFVWDYDMNRGLAWFLAIIFPYIFYVLGVKDLISVMSFVGGIAGGVSSTILFSIFLKIKDKKNRKTIDISINKYFIYLIIVMFLSGVIFELYQSIN